MPPVDQSDGAQAAPGDDARWPSVLSLVRAFARRHGTEAELAFRDGLTGAFNRRLLIGLFDELWPELIESYGQVSLVVVDVDRLKEVNDTHGHLAGDDVLKLTTVALERQFRRDDLIFRYGGDEFVILLPGAGPGEAERLAERARHAVESQQFIVPGLSRPAVLSVSFSLGVASGPDDGSSGEAVFEAADMRLLEEKHHRREIRLGSDGAAWRRGIRVAAATGLLAAAGVIGGMLGARLPARAPGAVPGMAHGLAAQGTTEVDELRQQIQRLEARLHELTRRGTEGGTVAGDLTHRSRLEALEHTVRELRHQVAAGCSSELKTALRTYLPPSGRQPATQGESAEPLLDYPPPLSVVVAEEPPRPDEVQVASSEACSVDRSGQPEALVTPPVLVDYRQPSYPPIARRMGREATVELEVVVADNGRVTAARRLGRAHGLGFERAARSAAYKARYRPAMTDSQPVAMATNLTVRFELEDW